MAERRPRLNLRVIALFLIGIVSGGALWSFFPRDPVVDGRTNIYEVQVFVHDQSGKTATDTGVTFLGFEPYKTAEGTGTRINVVPERLSSSLATGDETVELVVKVPVQLWGGKDKCDPKFKGAYCTDASGNWKKAVYSEIWNSASGHGAFEKGVFIPPYNSIGYGLGQNVGHIVVSLPQIVLPTVSAAFQPDVVMLIPNWRAYQWEGSGPDNSIATTTKDDRPAFLLNGNVTAGIYFAPGFTSSGYNPVQSQIDDRNLLVTGAILGVLGGVLVTLVAELIPSQRRSRDN